LLERSSFALNFKLTRSFQPGHVHWCRLGALVPGAGTTADPELGLNVWPRHIPVTRHLLADVESQRLTHLPGDHATVSCLHDDANPDRTIIHSISRFFSISKSLSCALAAANIVPFAAALIISSMLLLYLASNSWHSSSHRNAVTYMPCSCVRWLNADWNLMLCPSAAKCCPLSSAQLKLK